MIAVTKLALLFLPILAVAAPTRPFPAPSKEIGVLLLLPGVSRDWGAVIADVRKALSRKYVIESADVSYLKGLQASVNKLQAKRVKKLVVVPMLLSSHSSIMDQSRYLFGIREKPSKAFLDVPHSHSGSAPIKRAKSKVPVVLTPALDDHPLLAEIVAARAAKLGRDPAKESVVLVAEAPMSDQENSQWTGTVAVLAERVRVQGKYRSVRTAFLTENAAQDRRRKEERTLRSLVRKLSTEGRVIVVPLELTRGLDRRLRKVFDGLFVRFDGRAILPDKLIARWVEESLEKGVALPDMRAFKDDKTLKSKLKRRP